MKSYGKILIAVTGASGACYAESLLRQIHSISNQFTQCDVVFSETGCKVWDYELPDNKRKAIPFQQFENHDFFAPPASGSAHYELMMVCPCSMGTLAKMANGMADNLICRAADVMLKEKRKLAIMVRETPYNLIHLKNMEQLMHTGAGIFPASPAFYHKPQTIQELVDNTILHFLQFAGFKVNRNEWDGN